MSVTKYRDLILRLMPRGLAWRREAEKNLHKFITALAFELLRVDARGLKLLEERDARVTDELLSDWERFFGLPGVCGSLSPTIEGRRNDVVARLNSLGGQSRAYFIAVAASIGYTITIEEFEAGYNGPEGGGSIIGDEWAHVWLVRAPGATITDFRVGRNRVGDRLRTFTIENLQCLLEQLKPAHTRLIFAFTED